MRRIAYVLVMVSALALPSAGRADATIVASCNGAACSTGWYRTDVTVSFSVSGSNIKQFNCPTVTVSTDTAEQDVPCSVTLIDNTITGIVVPIKRDATPPVVDTVALARGPDANGWYNHPVGATATGTDALSGVAACTSSTYSGPDAGSATISATCTDAAGNTSAPKAVTFQYDATPPSVSPSVARAPDSNGWYNHAVAVSFSGSDALSGIDSCTSATYSGPDSGSASVGGSCRDKAGNTASASASIRYDATPPAVTSAMASRPPDSNGWYNHPLAVSFAGTDATSGIASCDAPSYDKPNGAHVSVTGTCRDAAGNVSAPGTLAFDYDSTPPTVAGLLVTAADRAVDLAWKPSADVVSTKIVRSRDGVTATVFHGPRPTSYTDRAVRNGVHYTYSVEVFDRAGNTAVVKASATPEAPLVSPRASARVAGGVTLRWRPVVRATYYNVQIWRGRTKILTAWPRATSYRVTRLHPGRYVWMIWPGFGERSRHTYGTRIGTSSFVVTR